MATIRKVYRKTSIDGKKGKQHQTEFVFDYEGVTLEDLFEPSEATMIITRQGQFRRDKKVPPQEKIKVKEFLASKGSRGVAVRDMTPEEILAKAAQDQDFHKKLQELLSKQQGAALAAGGRK